MNLSSDRILAAPVGGLPRPKALPDPIVAREAGDPADEPASAAQPAKGAAAVAADRLWRGRSAA